MTAYHALTQFVQDIELDHVSFIDSIILYLHLAFFHSFPLLPLVHFRQLQYFFSFFFFLKILLQYRLRSCVHFPSVLLFLILFYCCYYHFFFPYVGLFLLTSDFSLTNDNHCPLSRYEHRRGIILTRSDPKPILLCT